MSSLIAIAYPDEATAKNARQKLVELQKQQLITVEDAVVATHDGDKIKLDQAINLAGAGAAGGALWGGLFGLLFLMPVVGIAVGAATGAVSGRMADVGINDDFAREMGAKVTPGKAALVVLVRDAVIDRVVAEMKSQNFGGEIMQTNLSAEDEAKLREAATA